jgi:hypothetical protein
MSEKIKRFKAKDFKPYSNIVIIGKRETGKTSAIKWISYYKKSRMRISILISGTAKITGSFDGIIPNYLIHDNFNQSVIDEYVKMQISIRKESEKNKSKKKTDGLLILDDISDLDKSWQNQQSIKKMFTAGRHYLTDMIISLHNLMLLNPTSRGSADYIVITKITDGPSYKNLYENYWNPKFGSKKVFMDVLDNCTDNFKCLVIDNKTINTSSNLSDCIFWMKNPKPTKLKPFRLVIKSIWNLAADAEKENKKEE